MFYTYTPTTYSNMLCIYVEYHFLMWGNTAVMILVYLQQLKILCLVFSVGRMRSQSQVTEMSFLRMVSGLPPFRDRTRTSGEELLLLHN